MPLDMRVIRANEFIRVTPDGQTDLARSREVLSRLAAECVARGITRALLDVRTTPSPLSLVDLYELAGSFREMGFRPEHRIAILHPYDRAERARFFALCAANRGWKIRDFDTFEGAFEWFSESETVEPVGPVEPPRA